MNAPELAKLIVSEIYSTGNTYLIICFVIMLSGLTAFLIRYLERKAENYVTREDFQKLQEQLEKSTRVVEGIKAEVVHADWARREWFAIRSEKLEALHELLSTLMAEVDVAAIKAMSENLQTQSILNAPHTLALLYFPELFPKVDAFLTDVGNYFSLLQRRRIDQLSGQTIDWLSVSAEGGYRGLIKAHREIRELSATVLRESAIHAGLLPPANESGAKVA